MLLRILTVNKKRFNGKDVIQSVTRAARKKKSKYSQKDPTKGVKQSSNFKSVDDRTICPVVYAGKENI